MSLKYFPFRPALNGPFAKRFYDRIQHLCESKPSNGILEIAVQEEIKWATNPSSINPSQRRIYRAVWLLLRDLIRVGWEYRWNNGTFEIASPSVNKSVISPQELQREKQKIRQAMAATRLERIAEAREFIERMEDSSSPSRLSITALIADGRSLAADLSKIVSLQSDEERLLELDRKVQPYLQLVEDKRCELTGYKLGEIWRYFRFSWSTPSENTPGRTMLYLVRDAARPNHPVMGLASLENSPLSIKARDTYLGWTAEAFKAEVGEELENNFSETTIHKALKRLQTYISMGIRDLNLAGLCTAEECEHPTEKLLLKLAGISAKSSEERNKAIKEWHARAEGDDEKPMPERSDMGNLSKAAVEALYRQKRAYQLGRLLTARLELKKLLDSKNLLDTWKKFLDTDSSKSNLDTAIRTALQAIKNRHIGTSVLELNVCGAIPPYNHILGGKLVALLMLSPQVVSDYRQRYGNRPSDIASKMKGEDVIKPADLLFIGTTSLYHVGSSQYNRLKIPADLLRKQAPEVRWQKLGVTSGYGTLHISTVTLRSLEEAASSNKGTQYVHHVFGEGSSPKLRELRRGLETVLASTESSVKSAFMKHEMSRLVYGVWLASNGQAIFRGETKKPKYYFNQSESPLKGTEKIASYWRERWLLPRLSNAEVINRIATYDSKELLISNSFENKDGVEFEPISLEVGTMPISKQPEDNGEKREFIRNLYLGSSLFADEIDLDLLHSIHVGTQLDKAVIKAVNSGKSVVLTGNPGDGKTHLLRVLATRLEKLRNKPIMELDASTLTNTKIKSKWERAIKENRPFCIAINEAVLKGIADEYKKFAPAQEAQAQVEQAVLYGEEPAINSSVVVFDLSRRNVLSEKIVRAAIDKLTSAKTLERCSRCPVDGCDLVQNQQLIQTERFRSRLQALLNRTSLRGYHVTLRELQNLISYLLFGGRTCEQLLKESGNQTFALPQLPFMGKGRLFKILRQHFDPSRYTHPVWDERLISANINQGDWLPESPQENDSLDPNSLFPFEARKRAFYFYHAKGEELLTLARDDEKEFAKFLEMPEREALRYLFRQINSVFGNTNVSDELKVWQSHRYNQSPRRILYSSTNRMRRDFEIVHPRLRASMAQAFDLPKDQILLRLKARPQAKLKIDYALFELLAQAGRGVPVLSLNTDTTRRLWQFMEQLSEPLNLNENDELRLELLDPVTAEQLIVTIDVQEKRYLSITWRNLHDADSH